MNTKDNQIKDIKFVSQSRRTPVPPSGAAGTDDAGSMAVAKFWASQGMGRPLYRYRDPAGTTPPCCRRHSSGSSGGGERDPVDGVGEPGLAVEPGAERAPAVPEGPRTAGQEIPRDPQDPFRRVRLNRDLNTALERIFGIRWM